MAASDTNPCSGEYGRTVIWRGLDRAKRGPKSEVAAELYVLVPVLAFCAEAEAHAVVYIRLMTFISPNVFDSVPLAWLLVPTIFVLLIFLRDHEGRCGVAIRLSSSALGLLVAVAVTR